MHSDRIRIQVGEADFDLNRELEAVRRDRKGVGALAVFVGTVRDLNEGDAVCSMFLEHYPGMTERSLGDIAVKAFERWSLEAVTIAHRVGWLHPGDPIVLVVVASAHRHDAFEACAFVMDHLKTDAPFWKKEKTLGGERWVQARASDAQARERWLSAPRSGLLQTPP